MGKLSGSVAFVFGALSYFVPFLTGVPAKFWLTLGVVLMLLWLLTPLCLFIVRAIGVAYRRCRQYPVASAYAKKQNRELNQAKARLEEVVPYISTFELNAVLYWPDRQGYHEMYVVIAKHEETKLNLGDTLRVLDTNDEKTMGMFTVTQERQFDYYARGVWVDPIWRGYVHQNGQKEQYPPPDVVAKIMIRSTEDDG